MISHDEIFGFLLFYSAFLLQEILGVRGQKNVGNPWSESLNSILKPFWLCYWRTDHSALGQRSLEPCVDFF